MSTVALRGTLLKDNDEWHWKGMWGFGSNLASVAAQFQQPFWYTFHHAASPHQVAVPGYEEVEEMNATYDVRKATTVTTTATTSGRNVEKLAETDQQETKETIDAKQPTTNNDTKETTTRATDTIKDTEKEGISKDMTATMEESKKELHSEATTNTPANPEFHPDEEMEANKPTFAMVPPGHPSFLDALEKHPNCPPSGHWKGYFSNVARPRDKPQKVQEDFYLCLNGAPGPDVKFTFDESPLPPTVHPESLVLVRGK